VHRIVVLRRRRGEPRHAGDVGLVEHGRRRRRVGGRRADRTLGWPWTGENWPTRGWDMAMETSLACSSAAAALFAASFFSLSALPRVSVCRCSTSAARMKKKELSEADSWRRLEMLLELQAPSVWRGGNAFSTKCRCDSKSE
jgi:hypothetical protein